MKFYRADTKTAYEPDNALDAQYRAARQIGALRIGDDCLFFRAGLKTFCVPYREIRKCFRRIVAVPAKMCCGSGNFEIEHLVISDGVTEVAQIQLPGKRAAVEVIRVLKEKMPDTDFSAPGKAANA